MSRWQPIEKKPDAARSVLFYYLGSTLFDQDGREVDEEPFRDHRFELGYYDGREWREMGTGHDVFEHGREHPTHWTKLPEPPK